MIFTRRYIQDCINGLSAHVSETALARLVAKLNKPGNARLPAMWEVVILRALSELGHVDYEKKLPDGRTPDIAFSKPNAVSFTADITTISDGGLADANPIDRLKEEIEACKSRLGLPRGGIALEVGSDRTKTKKGPRTSLLLPPRKEIHRFVRERVEPVLRSKINKGEPLIVNINEPDVQIALTITQSQYSTTSHASYDLAESLTRNPLYNALDSKKRQLRASAGPTGIIVCDGASRSLDRGSQDGRAFTSRQIAKEFLRQNSSIDFVLVASVEETHSGWLSLTTERQMAYMLEARPDWGEVREVDKIFREMAEKVGQPKRSAINAAYRAREPGFGWGHHGGLTMSGSKVRLSSRLVMEVLSGRRSVQEMNELQGWRAVSDPHDNRTMFNPFDKWLEDGRLLTRATVELDSDDDDDWIEFAASERDAAISDFAVPQKVTWQEKIKRWIVDRLQ